MSNQTLLGSVIRAERKRRGLSQEALANLAGLSRSYVGEIERGEVGVSLAALEILALGLGVSLSEIIETYEQRSRQVDRENAKSP